MALETLLSYHIKTRRHNPECRYMNFHWCLGFQIWFTMGELRDTHGDPQTITVT